MQRSLYRHGGIASVLALTCLAIGLVGIAPASASVPLFSSAKLTADVATPPPGHWVAKSPINDPIASVTPQTQTACPAGTTAYTGVDAPYSCLTVFLDGGGHQVGLRQGRTGSETSGFGYLHAHNDHNVEEQTIEHAVQMNAAGIVQPRNRRLYGAEFVSQDGKTVEEFEAYEDRSPSTASPDSYALGIVTAFCRTGISGGISTCPQWVNDSL